MSFRHIFFDLDHTLWDFDRNAEETLQELYQTHELASLGLSCPDTFIETYTRNNHALWASYHLGQISKEELRQSRFRQTFLELGLLPESLPLQFEEDYVRICPTKTNLFPEVHETLTYLAGKYSLHLISNGFKESTELKLSLNNLEGYFSTVVISEDIGINKPDKAIFEYALNAACAAKEESIMIGDSLEADVRGAMNFGMEAIFFNPCCREKPEDVKRQIFHLSELRQIL